MNAKYIFRLDDASEFLDVGKWKTIEELFDRFSIKPIVGIIADNKDPSLTSGTNFEDFWELARSWQKKEWGIALHGHQHLFHSADRASMIFPFYDRSEFAGLDLGEQKQKIRRAWRKLCSEGLEPTIWIAPAHTFDIQTLKALEQETRIRIVSDGQTTRPYAQHGFYFVPQQLWGYVPKTRGLWTICLHPETMTVADFEMLERTLSNPVIKQQMISIDDVCLTDRTKNLADRFTEVGFWSKLFFKNILRNLVSPLLKILKRLSKI